MPLPALRAGDLRNRIAFRRPNQVQNAHGGYDTQWVDVCTVWAEVQGLDGRESVMDSALQGISTYRIRIRYREGIRVSDQIEFRGTSMNVRSQVDPNGNREQLLIIADTASVRAEI